MVELLVFCVMCLVSASFGALRMRTLIENPDVNIAASNFRLAFWGSVCGLISIYQTGLIGLITSFAFGVCFGLIGVTLIYEKIVK